jgi:hypothetical protein
MYQTSILHFFCQNLLAAIVSLFLFAGYTHDFFVDCSDHHNSRGAEHGTAAPGNEGGCYCLCHIFGVQPTAPPPATESAFAPIGLAVNGEEFPPDALPHEIDYPPQLT